MTRHSLCTLAAALVLALGSGSTVAAQRVFVSSTGSDANTASSCAPTTPCRSFTAGMTVVDPGGEIVAMDAAGYGAVTIDKSVSILANPGFFAGIAASSGSAITIATADVQVVLRGLYLNGVGAIYGVQMTNGAALTVENCVISNFADSGILVMAPAKVRITDTVLRANGLDGAYLLAGVRAAVSNLKASRNARSGLTLQDFADSQHSRAVVSDSDLSGNTYGVVAYSTTAAGSARASVVRSTIASNANIGMYAFNLGGTAATAAIGNSVVTGNGIGLDNSGAGFDSQSNNFVHGNGTNTNGFITGVGSM